MEYSEEEFPACIPVGYRIRFMPRCRCGEGSKAKQHPYYCNTPKNNNQNNLRSHNIHIMNAKVSRKVLARSGIWDAWGKIVYHSTSLFQKVSTCPPW